MGTNKTNNESFETRIETMEKFVALSFRREIIVSPASSLARDVEMVKDLMISANQLLENELGILEQEHDKLMRYMRAKQTIIMNHLLKLKKSNLVLSEESCEMENKQQSVKKGSTALEITSARKHLGEGVTPKMTIYDYKESPLVIRSRPNPLRLNFIEFEFVITEEMFRKVGRYILGRESLEELNNFLETVIIACFNEKYQLIYRKRNTLRKPKELELWKLYTQQESYIPGKYFITAGDISRKIEKMLDKKLHNRIVILRNIGILKEERVSQTVCYVWTGSN